MATVLPFDGFLDLLRAKGYAVGLREHFALATLIERWGGTNRVEFRDAIAALVGRTDDEVQGIRRLFGELYGDPVAPAETPVAAAAQPSVEPSGRTRLRWVWAGALAFVVVCAALGIRMLRPPPAAPPPVPPVAPPAAPLPATVDLAVTTMPAPPPPNLPAPPASVRRWVVAAVVGGMFVATLGALGLIETRGARRRALRRIWSATISALPGPHRFTLVVRGRRSSLARADMEDAATILGRAFAWETPARELDVDRSVRATLRRGLLARLVFKPRRHAQPILVLQDVGPDMTVWRTKVQLFLTDLARQGIALERFYFDGDLGRIADRPHRAPALFESILRRRPGAPVLVISTGATLAGLPDADEPEWLVELRARTRRSWLTPVADVRLWPVALGALSIPVWPMTRRGLTQAARDLAGLDAEAPAVVRPRLAAEGLVTLDGIERMKRLASLVPHPTADLIEALRSRFAPDVPDAVVLHLFAEADGEPASVLRLSEEELRRCLDAVRAETPGLEAEVRRVVVETLKDSEPPAGSAAHVRWEAAVALQELVLADLQGAETAGPIAALRRLGQGPAWEEVRQAARLVPNAPTLAAQLDTALGTDAGEAAAAGRAEQPEPSGWSDLERSSLLAPRQLVLAAVAAAVVLVAGSWLNLFPVRTLAHVADAYHLTYVPAPPDGPERLIVTARPDPPVASGRDSSRGAALLPKTVDLYQDDRLFRTGVPVQDSLVPIRVREDGVLTRSIALHELVRAFENAGEVTVSFTDQRDAFASAQRVIADLMTEGDEARTPPERIAFAARASQLAGRADRLQSGGAPPDPSPLWTTASGRVVEIKKRVGDVVQRGDIVGVVERLERLPATESRVLLASFDGGHYYQARARLPEGQLALSEAVWVPSGDLVTVLIDAWPWARVTVAGARSDIRDQATPFFVTLAPGTYRLHFENRGLNLTMDREITVTPTANVFRFPMPGFDAAAAAAALSGRGR